MSACHRSVISVYRDIEYMHTSAKVSSPFGHSDSFSNYSK